MNKIFTNKVVLNFSVFCIFASLFVFVDCIKAAPIKLTHPLIDMIDGVHIGINGNTFHLIVDSRSEVRKRLIGILPVGKQYDFDGKKFALAELAVLDKQLASKNDAESKAIRVELKKTLHIAANDFIGFYDFEDKKYFLSELIELEKQLISKGDAQSKARFVEMQKLLNFAKEDFINFTSAYMGSAKGIKPALLGIMKEFHEKSGLGEFFLLNWVSVPDGGEMESVRTNVKSFVDLKILCTEMAGFLEAMANSCPKGKKLFIEMIKEKEAAAKK